MREIEAAFQSATALLLGRKLCGMGDYAEWLMGGLPARVATVKSAKSGAAVYIPTLEPYGPLGRNSLTLAESLEHGSKSLSMEEVEQLGFANASKSLAGIKATTPEVVYDKNIGTEECADYGPTQHCYRSAYAWFGKYYAYSFWPRTSEHMFGCSAILDSKFCIRCHGGTRLTRCFEVSDATDCSDIYFCHNVENVHESMFCFNTKNKRYAIGNFEVGREKYLEIRQKLLAEIADELERKKSFRYTIFNIGCAR